MSDREYSTPIMKYRALEVVISKELNGKPLKTDEDLYKKYSIAIASLRKILDETTDSKARITAQMALELIDKIEEEKQ
ncbi:MAG: hypothetical protein FWF42_00040 [Streptococcaceae bacterium]|nr:hypothetical protein [Streptococcaceae bacterium]MCL2680866.1 hypothetical protein [Streptococcaceae bacterium]MCL2858063.1 hypothetical protein [Streptococcaceae bacterium]